MRAIVMSSAVLAVGAISFFDGTLWAMSPEDPGPADLLFSISAIEQGSPISPFIYGINGSLRPKGISGIRLGGNRWTGYNWETNNSNAGGDYFHVNDEFLTGAYGQITSPGQAILPTLQEAHSLGAASAVTIPMAGFVSADANGTVTPAETAPSSRWLELQTRKSSVYPGASLSLVPDLNDAHVFADEFVHWVESNRQDNQPVMYLLDNEPGLWDDTHPYLIGSTNPTFADVGQRSIDTATMIKDIAPDAVVLGGVTFGWSGMQFLHDAPDFDLHVPPDEFDLRKLHFNRWLLEEMAAAEQSQGRVLMDALDIHWYPEAQGGGVRIIGNPTPTPELIEARVQAPRSLWDPTYIEDSWIANDILRDYSGQGENEGVELLNRIQADIDEIKPETRISISEYNYGGGNHISGAVAQADVLGIFGRHGVYNASWWPIESEGEADYVRAAIEMFTNFDGAGGKFGDISISAETDDISKSAIYASRATAKDDELILVAINRTNAPLDAAIVIEDTTTYTEVEVYRLTDVAPAPESVGLVTLDTLNSLVYSMPAYSVSTLRLIAGRLEGDFNGDLQIDLADYTIWRDQLGDVDASIDVDRSGVVDLGDYEVWRSNFGDSRFVGNGQSAAQTAEIVVSVPLPTSLMFLLTGLPLALRRR